VKKHQLWLLAVILPALAVRLHNLTYHSLWLDEAVSVYWARQSVPRILEVGFTLVEDRLPPLYYLILNGWAGLAGFSETAVRLPSVGFGVLLIPALAGLAAMLFGRRAALLAALLAAFNPFLVWYSQEARMYAPAALFGALAVWAWLKTCRHWPSRGSAAYTGLFILFAVAGLYSHLYAGFLLPALGLWLLISYPRQGRLIAMFAAAGLIIAALYAPIALAIWRFSAESTPTDPLAGLAGRAWGLLHSFTVWKAPLPLLLSTAIPLTITLFALAAYLKAPRPNPGMLTRPLRNPHLLVTLLLAMPFAIAAGLLARNHLAFFGERYFIVITPWLLLLAAAGANTITDRLQTAGPAAYLPAAALLLTAALPLPGQWSVSAAKEGWRQSVAYLAQHAAADHAILIHPDWVRYPFQFYFNGPGQTYAAFSTITPQTALDGPLAGVVGDHPVVWLIQSHLDGPDPNRRVEQWFAARYPLVTELYPPGISLKGYAPGYQLTGLPPEAVPTNLRFAGGLRLVGYRAEPSAAAADTLFHPPSGWLHVTLYWQAGQPLNTGVSPFVHMVGPQGVWGASLDRPTDALKLFPPNRWPPGLIIRHDLDINLNPATPPGRYQLVVGLTESGEQFSLTEVEIK
jgi:4-amino-4-deoxy-L-arabinose transferase-like glycosyltransferase